LFSASVRKPGGVREERSDCASAGAGAACLSMGHNVKDPASGKGEASRKPVASFYEGAALGKMPGIPNLKSRESLTERKVTPRGKVLTFSGSSRRNLQRFIATLLVKGNYYTGALTLGDPFRGLPPEIIKEVFKRLGRHLSAMASVNPTFEHVAAIWKQELQKSGALHFHLVLSGKGIPEMEKVWKWICRKWIELLFELSGVDLGNEVEERRKMVVVHLNAKNWEKIRGNFHAYFAKYLGKAEERMVAENPIPGRWWGKWNQSALPLGELKELILPARVAVSCHRMARKVRQERANDSKHRQICRQVGAWDISRNVPLISRQTITRYFQRLKSGSIDPACMSSNDLLCVFAVVQAEKLGLSFGRYVFKRCAAFASITLVGQHVPEMMLRMFQQAGSDALEHKERNPF
jgi:hypothetical protein